MGFFLKRQLTGSEKLLPGLLSDNGPASVLEADLDGPDEGAAGERRLHQVPLSHRHQLMLRHILHSKQKEEFYTDKKDNEVTKICPPI